MEGLRYLRSAPHRASARVAARRRGSDLIRDRPRHRSARIAAQVLSPGRPRLLGTPLRRSPYCSIVVTSPAPRQLDASVGRDRYPWRAGAKSGGLKISEGGKDLVMRNKMSKAAAPALFASVAASAIALAPAAFGSTGSFVTQPPPPPCVAADGTVCAAIPGGPGGVAGPEGAAGAIPGGPGGVAGPEGAAGAIPGGPVGEAGPDGASGAIPGGPSGSVGPGGVEGCIPAVGCIG